MKAHLNLSPSGCMWLELQAEGVAEHQMLNHWAYRCQVHGVYAGQQVPGGNQMVLRDGLAHPAVPPSRPGVGSVEVKLPENPGPLPAGYKVPDHFVTVPIEPAAAPQATRCRACQGQTASTLCERELVASREAVRRLWCHVQALGYGVGLGLQSKAVLAALRGEVEALARVAGVA